MLTQSEIIGEISSGTGITRKDVKSVLEVLEEIAVDELKAGEKFKIGKLVQLQPKIKPARKSRMGRNPRTGEAVKIPAKKASVTVKARVLSEAKKATPPLKKMQAVAK